MPTLLRPQWLWLLNTLPLILLVLLCYGDFVVVRSLLPAASLAVWGWLSLALACLGGSTLGYGLWQAKRQQLLGVPYALTTLAGYTSFLYYCFQHDLSLVPTVVPQWMVTTHPTLYALTFVMPTLAHALLVLVIRLTPETERSWQKAGVNIVAAFVVAGASVGALTALGGMLDWLLGDYSPLKGFLGTAGLLGCTLLFLFFLTRGAYIISLRRLASEEEAGLGWKVAIGIVLPILGLLLNNGAFWGGISLGQGIFGDFSSPWFYGLAVLNGVLLCLPGGRSRWLRLALLLGRSITFSYTFYFFLVFLPFLPLSMIVVVAIGIGFLMLTPLLLLVMHTQELRADYQQLRPVFPRALLPVVLLGGVLLLPLGLTGYYLHDRQVLHAALAYRYSPDYTKQYQLDAEALGRTLAVLKQHKERRDDLFSGSQQLPYLSRYFNWLVLDNLTLSDEKIASLEEVFLGARAPEEEELTPVRSSTAAAPPVLTGLTTRSTYDARQQAWVSWVELRVTNTDTTQRRAEYATTLTLPPGCWVSDYYLTIDQRREPGILAEKKAATWVYNQIVGEAALRDPGLLTYLDARRVRLRVYPVTGAQPRTTGFQLLHREPLTLTVDGRQFTLGDSSRATAKRPGNEVTAGVAYVSAAAKQRLPLTTRQPYYHFLLDASTRADSARPDYRARLRARFDLAVAQDSTRFTLVDAYATPVAAGAQWEQQLAAHAGMGGFYLDGALRRLLFAAHERPAGRYPIFVVVTDNLERAVLSEDYAELSPAYPESDVFYVLGADGRLTAHSLLANPRQPLPAALPPGTPHPVRAWPDATRPRAYLPDNGRADLVLTAPRPALPATLPGLTRWQTGLALHGYQQWQAFHPEATEADRLPLVQASFRSGILTPFTAYLALENAAQKAALRRKQAQVLAGNANLDAGEEASDPVAVPIDGEALWLLGGALGLGLWQLRRVTGPRRATT